MNVHVPRRTSATLPSRLPGASGSHASPAPAISNVPSAGTGWESVAEKVWTGRSSGESVNPRTACLRLSTDATAITPSPTAGAPIAQRPSGRSLPAPATTTTPLRTSRAAACAVGDLRPAAQVLGDAHVEHVGAIAVDTLHRREHHVGRGPAAVAAEHAVGAERDVRRDAGHAAVRADDPG